MVMLHMPPLLQQKKIMIRIVVVQGNVLVKDIQLKTRLGGVVLHLLSRLLPRKVCPTNLLYQGLVDRE
jgi:hypothetical protein